MCHDFHCVFKRFFYCASLSVSVPHISRRYIVMSKILFGYQCSSSPCISGYGKPFYSNLDSTFNFQLACLSREAAQAKTSTYVPDKYTHQLVNPPFIEAMSGKTICKIRPCVNDFRGMPAPTVVLNVCCNPRAIGQTGTGGAPDT